jgi:hypothetical protein
MVLILLGGVGTLAFSHNLSKENRALIILMGSIGMIACFTGLMYAGSVRKWLRRQIWLQAMSAWKESSRARKSPHFEMADDLSENGLRRLAVQSYSRMGYRILNNREDEYIQLSNPEGQVELVACRLQPALTELHHVHSLQLEMKRTKAVRGFYWAPAGFTGEATQWVLHRPIILADRSEIGRLVECAHGKGLTWLKYL